MIGDLKLAVRRLLAAPLFVAFAIVSLAIGIGVTTAFYSIVQAFFWPPLGIAGAGRVAMLTTPGTVRPRWQRIVSRPDFEDLRASHTSFATLSATLHTGQILVGEQSSEFVDVEAVTSDYFATLGIAPELGRLLQPDDDGRQAVVLGHRLWRRQFHADPAIVGRVVRLGGLPFEVVGVAPRTFSGVARLPVATAVWIPLDAQALFPRQPPRTDRERRQLSVVGRLAPGRAPATAAAEIRAIAGGLDGSHPIHNERYSTDQPRVVVQRGWTVMPVEDALTSGETRAGILLIGLVGLVLVVACTNLANLMLARGTMRQHEIAVRRALGASRWRLVRELCLESAIVGVLGGLLGLALTRVLLVAGTIEIPVPRGALSIEPALSWTALLIAAGAVLLSVIVFGLEPAIQLTRVSVTRDLGGQSGAVPVPRSRRQRALITWQVAISTGFFLIAAILARVIAAGALHDPGIDVERLALASVHVSALGWDEARARQTLDRAVEIASREPGIESVAISSGMPFGSSLTPYASMTTPDKPFVKGREFEGAYLLASTPAIFRTLGVPIVRGRAFDAHDDAAATRVAVISERTSRVMFGTTDAVGRALVLQLTNAGNRPPAETYAIVGIARDTDAGRMMYRQGEVVYVPFAQHYQPNLFLVGRTPGSPAAAARALQSALRQADPDLGTGTAGAASILVAGEMVAARIAGSLALALGLLTLVLSMIGLYGIQTHLVALRTREVGVRMALGATVAHVQRMMLRQGYRPVIEGVILGIAFGVIARLGLRALLTDRIEIVDPIALLVVPIPLFAAAFLACWLPARRAARVDPNVALRHL